MSASIKAREFATAVSFTVEETMRKKSRSGEECVPFVKIEKLEYADLAFLDWNKSKWHKVIIDGLNHFELDIDKNLLSQNDPKQFGQWRACRIPPSDEVNGEWLSPIFFPDSTHTIILVIGPHPAYILPFGKLRKPLEAPVSSAFLIANDENRILLAAQKTSTILMRGAR